MFVNQATFAIRVAYWGNRLCILLPKYANDANEDIEAEEEEEDEEENHDDGDKYKEDGGDDEKGVGRELNMLQKKASWMLKMASNMGTTRMASACMLARGKMVATGHNKWKLTMKNKLK